MYTVIISCSYNHLVTLPSHPKCHLYTPHLAKRKPFKESLWLSSVMIWLLMEIAWRVWRWLWNSVLWWERPLGWKLLKLDMFFVEYFAVGWHQNPSQRLLCFVGRLVGYGSSLWNHLIFVREVFWSISVFPDVLWCFNIILYCFDSWIRIRSAPNLKLLWWTFDPNATCAISPLKQIHSPWKQAFPKRKGSSPSIHFQGEHVGFAECWYRLSGITGTVGTMETLNWLWVGMVGGGWIELLGLFIEKLDMFEVSSTNTFSLVIQVPYGIINTACGRDGFKPSSHHIAKRWFLEILKVLQLKQKGYLMNMMWNHLIYGFSTLFLYKVHQV